MVLPREFVVLDTETTGSPPGARVVEIGALKLRGHNLVDRFHALVYPECPIPQGAVAVHGITDRDVADSPTADEVLPEFLRWIGNVPLVAHNARFDAAMIGSECARFGIAPGENPVLCTLAASRKLLRRKSHSLENLVQELGLPPGRHHRAVEDAEHALHLLWRMAELFPSESGRGLLGRGMPLSNFMPESPRLPRSRRTLEEAAVHQEPVDLHYCVQGQRTLPLRVTPRFFYRRGRALLMEALCHQDLHYKSYRLDRIVAAHLCLDAPPVSARRRPPFSTRP